MSLNLSGVHVYKKAEGTMHAVLTEVHPIMRFSSQGQCVFLQHGEFFYEGGDLAKPLPDWVMSEVEKANPSALAECGYEVRERLLQKGAKE